MVDIYRIKVLHNFSVILNFVKYLKTVLSTFFFSWDKSLP